ncbi:MarR family winged helix-turn-helix transcriptional regulator [Streptomyces hiroshimensis]|uniref:MarR family transcriptional regulator n=1 Tax=Streptomyces hiroshimensis TaxID=66424 RepID=A0ABQ2ZBF4_9ACTN|nr:MarR family transcriptional regulator [Streptomyces hiroshimensis]GGY11024.1 MarR family transcriptional regulator [Streptomyces hiroshimensis]
MTDSPPGGDTPLSSARERYPVSFAVFGVARTHRALASALLRDLGLYPGQEIMLLQLWERDGQSQQALGKTLGLDHSTVAKSLRRLAAAGLVTRQRSDADRRVTLVSLTPEGRALESRVAEVWAELEERATAGLSEEQRAQFVATARAIEAAIEPGAGIDG